MVDLQDLRREKDELVDIEKKLEKEKETKEQINPRITELMDKKNEGVLTPEEKIELKTLETKNEIVYRNIEELNKTKVEKTGKYEEMKKKATPLESEKADPLENEKERGKSLARKIKDFFSFKALDTEKEQLKKNSEKIKQLENLENDATANEEERTNASRQKRALLFENEALQNDINEREQEEKSLKQKIKEIFKKHGVTVASVILAAGVTIGVVMSVLKNSLKNLGEKLGNGLKQIGKKTAEILPGLIGSIVSFLFRTAASVVGFLAKNTWLIILLVVAFLFDKYSKKLSEKQEKQSQ